jgi:ATP synthase F1 gamma subunit
MPGTKEIRTKIASVKSTQKITKAMQMVATSKMRRAQDRMKLARPYAQKMRNVIGHLTRRTRTTGTRSCRSASPKASASSSFRPIADSPAA